MNAGEVFMAVWLVVFWWLVFLAAIFAIGAAFGKWTARRMPTVTHTFVTKGSARLTPRQIERVKAWRSGSA